MPIFVPTVARAPMIIIIMVVMPPVVMNPYSNLEFNPLADNLNAAPAGMVVFGWRDDDADSLMAVLAVPLIRQRQPRRCQK